VCAPAEIVGCVPIKTAAGPFEPAAVDSAIACRSAADERDSPQGKYQHRRAE